MILDTSACLYGVIGNPVSHSASPRLFNTIFTDHRYNGVYLAFENSSVEGLIGAMRELPISGFSVTIPFKEEVMNHLDEWDETARRLGCANTVWNNRGRLIGYNFDGWGALSGLDELADRRGWDWRKADFFFLGNGGAARGILLTLIGEKNFSGGITIIARNPAKTEKIIADAHVINPDIIITPLPWDCLDDPDFSRTNNSVVINTTSLGMSSHSNISPLPSKSDFWREGMVAYDIVYNPLHTLFLKDAEKAGAYTITGLNMFLGQARLQLKTWTGIEISLSDMRRYFQESTHESL